MAQAVSDGGCTSGEQRQAGAGSAGAVPYTVAEPSLNPVRCLRDSMISRLKPSWLMGSLIGRSAATVADWIWLAISSRPARTSERHRATLELRGQR